MTMVIITRSKAHPEQLWSLEVSNRTFHVVHWGVKDAEVGVEGGGGGSG